MKWESFKNKFDESWWDVMRPFIESKECDEIYAFLKNRSSKGAQVAPASINTFRVFKETKLEDVQCILLFEEPYFFFENEMPIADGFALGCSITEKAQPLLKKFYSNIESELFNGLNLNWNMEEADVNYLAYQGVLMLNKDLTVEKDVTGSHKDLWKPFINHLMLNYVHKYNIPIMFMGKDVKGNFTDLNKITKENIAWLPGVPY
jgi:uracil DNA glycosylase